MTTREDIIQGVRSWIKASSDLTPLSDAQVIKSEQDGPRPQIPYLTVGLTTFDIVVGSDDIRSGLDGSGIPTVSVRGQRRATATVQAFGDLATEWLTEAKSSIWKESAKAILKDAGLSVSILGSGQSNIAAVIADQTELRSTQDFDIAYTYNSNESTSVQLDVFDLGLTLESESPPGDFVINTSIQVC